jgi:peptidoglycan hydrolase CwlO-like protein
MFNSHIDDIYKVIDRKDGEIKELKAQIKKLEEKQDHLLE